MDVKRALLLAFCVIAAIATKSSSQSRSYNHTPENCTLQLAPQTNEARICMVPGFITPNYRRQLSKSWMDMDTDINCAAKCLDNPDCMSWSMAHSARGYGDGRNRTCDLYTRGLRDLAFWGHSSSHFTFSERDCFIDPCANIQLPANASTPPLVAPPGSSTDFALLVESSVPELTGLFATMAWCDRTNDDNHIFLNFTTNWHWNIDGHGRLMVTQQPSIGYNGPPLPYLVTTATAKGGSLLHVADATTTTSDHATCNIDGDNYLQCSHRSNNQFAVCPKGGEIYPDAGSGTNLDLSILQNEERRSCENGGDFEGNPRRELYLVPSDMPMGDCITDVQLQVVPVSIVTVWAS